ncbi:zincin [Testicularia cyperi]|uniref:Zincin n=1 Tax=Testicularia cyperi TaxID=1882483 RepID=A0A317XUR6_9BASI|nr:zincin [Testicularia cyperi]
MFKFAAVLAGALAASSAVAMPMSASPVVDVNHLVSRGTVDRASAEWKIHESCNGTQRAQISRGLDDMRKLAEHTVQHILNNPMDEYFVRYFGEEADPAPVIGYYEQVLFGDKKDALLRCDNPDDNCRLEGWAGHWRGNNATSETVICDYTYTSRRSLEQLCAFGFQLAQDNQNLILGADLMHRAFHVPPFVHEKVHHYADDYYAVLELAKTNSSAAIVNQYTLQYFALDVYSRTMVEEGCIGTIAPKVKDDSHAAPAAAATTTSAAAAAASPTAAAAASSDCHTHADGSVHCGSH